MRLNGQAILTSEGIRFKRKEAAFLNALGIGDSGDHDDATVCWGVWLDTRDRAQFHHGSRPSNDPHSMAPDERQFPHLIVSPLHPFRWTSAFRIEAFLDRAFVPRDSGNNRARDPLRAGYRLMEELNSFLGVKTLRTEGGISGYDLFVLNALCEIPELRARIDADDTAFLQQVAILLRGKDHLKKDRVQALRQDRMKQVGLKLVPALTALCAAVEVRDSNCRGVEQAPTPFLNHRIVTNGARPWFLSRPDLAVLLDGPTELPGIGSCATPLAAAFESILREKQEHDHPSAWSERAIDSNDYACSQTVFAAEEFRRTLRQHGVAAMSARALTSLAYARLFSFPEEPPIRFVYRKGWGLTFADGPDRVFSFLQQFVGKSDPWMFDRDKPHRVITAFHLQDNFVRMRFVRHEFARSRMRTMRVQFTVQAPQDQQLFDSRGVLRTAIDRLTKQPFRLRVEKIVTRPILNAPDHESGVIRLLVKTAGAAERTEVQWVEVERTIDTAIRDTLGTALTDLHVTSESWAPEME